MEHWGGGCRLSPPSVAFSDGERWKKVPRTGLNAGPELRETMWISLAGHERIIIKIRIAIKRLFSQSAVDTWPTFATLGPSIFAANHQKRRDEQELNYGKSN